MGIKFQIDIPEPLRHLADPLLIAAYAGQDEGVEEYANAYRLQILWTDSLASHEFLDSVDTRTVQEHGFSRIREAFSDVIQATIMEQGLEPGHFPPVAAIYQWMHYKPMEPSWSGAFLIARAIFRRGIRPRHVAERAFEIATPTVVAFMEAAMDKAVEEINKP